MTTVPADRRALAVLALSGLALGLAIWLLPASHHVVAWQDGAPGRVALLAPISRLVWAALAGVCLAGVVGWWWRLTGRPLWALARLCGPVQLLWLWGVPYLPWLPTKVPVLLLLTGPLRWLVVGFALVGCVAGAADTGQLRLGNLRWPGRRLVFAASLVVFLGVGHYVKQAQGYGGDEPHYLVLTHSLLVDRDLRIENNHQNRDYLDFHGGELPMHYLERGRGGVIYSIHSPGLPALLLPAYAIAGHRGALAMVGLMAALAALAIFDLASLIGSPPIALATWAAVAFTIPFGLQSWLIFPEMAAALLMAWSALWVWRDVPDRLWPWIWRGAALSLLPWLHMKFSLLLLVSGLWLAFRLRSRMQLAFAFLAPIAVSGVFWFGSFYVMYGDVNPTVAYGYSQGAELDWLNIPRGLLGLAFDQEYGLLPYSPIFAVSLLGAWVMTRHRDTRGYLVGVLLVIAPYLASTTQYYMWWGGASVPARFVVPILPLLAPMIAIAVRDVRDSAARGGMALALGFSLLAFVAVVVRPGAMLMYNDRDGTGRFLETLQDGVPLTATLPSFIDPDIFAQLPSTLVWVLAAVLAAVVTRQAARHVRTGPFGSAVVALLVFGGFGSALAAATLPASASWATVQAGRQRLLNVYPGERFSAFGYESGAWLSDAELLAQATLEMRLDPVADRDQSRLAGPFGLPPGRYDFLVWFTDQQVDDGNVFVSDDRNGGSIVRADGRSTNPAVVPFELPVGLRGLRVGATSTELAKMVSRVAIVPRRLVPRRARPDVGRVWAVRSVGERTGAYLFSMDLNSFVEPDINWVRGGYPSEFLVSSADATRMRVVIRNGGVDNRIVVRVGDLAEQLDLVAWETHQVDLPVSPGGELISMSIHPEGGFVPAEVEPGSTDTRRLGCQVTVFLE